MPLRVRRTTLAEEGGRTPAETRPETTMQMPETTMDMKGARRVSRRMLAIAGLLLASCTPLPPDIEEARTSLRAAAEAYAAAASAKDAETVVSMYDTDALMIPPNAELVDGLAGVQEYRFGFIETPGVSLEFELVRVEVAASGDIGWSFAIGDITIDQGDEEPGRDIVRDFHTWRRQSDGSWKVVVDMWNSGMPAG